MNEQPCGKRMIDPDQPAQSSDQLSIAQATNNA
jgi:hypothetical protein